ncbi:Fe(3+)-hydroxamate ABC transporter permease FhuB [Neorhizobium sp. NCHU2750]|uniref:Fe(3+)-hydroxamate ABC transporter permease FhuB n=1 Tax=Neorhizobium sp. NCHU2750 TaxID=1825976 RepID=UPI0013C42D37
MLGSSSPRLSAATALILAVCLAIGLSLGTLAAIQEPSLWLSSIRDPQADVAALVFVDVALPRIVVSWIVGAGLALSGVILQQVLQNPIAEPATVGISGGSYVALAVTSLWFPSLLADGGGLIALGGGLISAGLVLAICRRQRFSPNAVVIGGLTINLFFGAIGAVLTVLNHDYLSSLSIWQSGSLIQNGWGTVEFLAPRMLAGTIVIAVIARPLAMLTLGDEIAASRGVRVSLVRVAGLGIASALAALCVAGVGVFGFVALMASQIARLMGANTFGRRLIWSPLIGCLLLWLTDQCVQVLHLRQEISTGTATALIGSLCLLILLVARRAPETLPPEPPPGGHFHAWVVVSGRKPAMLLFATALAFAIGFGHSPPGWAWLSPETAAEILPWRLPRVVAAGSAGAMLAISGVLLQRMTGNPMASPEVLGISSGAALGVIMLLLCVSGYSAQMSIVASTAGAILSLAALLVLTKRTHVTPNRLLLVGISLATLLSACSGVLLTSGDPRSAILLTWMSGSTYRVSETAAYAALISALAAIPLASMLSRWLTLLSLGDGTATSLGVDLSKARSAILIIAGVLTATATVIVGPLTFVGLVAPHIAKITGNRKPREEIASAAAIGSVLLMVADWLGRNLVYPWQIPAGLVAAVIGAPIFLWLMQKSKR